MKRSKPELTKSSSITLSREKYKELMCANDLFGFKALFTSWQWNGCTEEEDYDNFRINFKRCVLRHTIDESKGLIEGRDFHVSILLDAGEIEFFDGWNQYSSPEGILRAKYNFRCYPDGLLDSGGKEREPNNNNKNTK